MLQSCFGIQSRIAPQVTYNIIFQFDLVFYLVLSVLDFHRLMFNGRAENAKLTHNDATVNNNREKQIAYIQMCKTFWLLLCPLHSRALVTPSRQLNTPTNAGPKIPNGTDPTMNPGASWMSSVRIVRSRIAASPDASSAMGTTG